MMRTIVLCAALSMLEACATRSSDLPAPSSTEPAAPIACDPRMTVTPAPRPDLPAGASIVQPVTPDERAATQAFLTGVAAIIDWGSVNAVQAEAGRAWCAARATP